jgi:hypothetical protein
VPPRCSLGYSRQHIYSDGLIGLERPVEIEREKAGDRRVGDLLHLLALGRETRRGEGEHKELALAGLDATDIRFKRDRVFGSPGAPVSRDCALVVGG